MVNGMPLSQYSMSEDAAGNFRILTKTRSPQLASYLFVLDKDMDLAGTLMNIEPGEEFKSSRYIGDKLYLVTFQQTDPLFVIDIADVSHPEILGELKIPGFSTYLHPYAPLKDGVQYLLGLGYDTTLNQR
ncbi:MAG: beta-propeller domain-containing protein [Candidatus Peribacteria bacterium]|nr:MAG: beta-propeller domain-containing protein [Candidatus Peribacteria bacterium]